jgi:hypothetical protein
VIDNAGKPAPWNRLNSAATPGAAYAAVIPARLMETRPALSTIDGIAAGYVTVYPCGETLPNASNVNFTADTTVANLVVAKLGTGGRLCVYSSAVVDVIIDVAGYQPG